MIHLFDTAGFFSKAACGPGWTPAWLWTFFLVNAAIGVIYTAFFSSLYFILAKRHMPQVRPAIKATALFGSTCGLAHFGSAATTWWACYPLAVTLDCLNALTSISGLVWLLVAIHRVKHVPIRSELEDDIEKLHEECKLIREQANQAALRSAKEAHAIIETSLQALRLAREKK